MTGEQLLRIRERLGMSKADLAALLNENLDRKYRAERVGEWERDKPPRNVAAFMEHLALEAAPELPDLESLTGPTDPTSDTPPPAPDRDTPPPPSGQLAIGSGGGIYAKVCTDLWATVALGLTSMGAVVGNPALMSDGQIIDADKEALGRAWGKLAETNETFRNMLMTTVTGGAWLEILLVTGVTANKLVANHRVVAMQEAAKAEAKARTEHGDHGLHAA